MALGAGLVILPTAAVRVSSVHHGHVQAGHHLRQAQRDYLPVHELSSDGPGLRDEPEWVLPGPGHVDRMPFDAAKSRVVPERVREPAQILIGLTAMGTSRFAGASEATLKLQRDWPNGTFAEVAHVPASVLTQIPEALSEVPAQTLAGISKFLVPYGGLLRGGLLPGETAIINGASGYFGSAGALLALRLGAARVVAAGRNRTALGELRELAGPRLIPVTLSGDVEADARALAEAAGGRADMALDMIGGAKDSRATLATLQALVIERRRRQQ